MGVFIQAPFWALRYAFRRSLHAISVVVQSAVTIASSSVANPTVITTAAAHGYVTGDTVTIAGHTGSTPAVDGSRIVTVLTPTTFSVPVNVSVGGTGGTVTRTIPAEPLTLTEGKLRAGLDWTAGDARDALMTGFIAAARNQVEHDTGLALLSQVRDVYFDAVYDAVIEFPGQSMPLQSVSSIKTTSTAGVVSTLATDQYLVDTVSGRISLSDIGVWPTDLQTFQPWVIRIVSGYVSVAAMPPLLVHAVGLLTAHYATLGRDLASIDQASEVPFGYRDAIAPYTMVRVA